MKKQDSPELEDVVLNAVREVLDPDQELDHDTSLEDVGLDSLTLTQVLLSIEEKIGIWLDEQYLTPEHLKNARTLARCLREQRSSSNESPSGEEG